MTKFQREAGLIWARQVAPNYPNNGSLFAMKVLEYERALTPRGWLPRFLAWIGYPPRPMPKVEA